MDPLTRVPQLWRIQDAFAVSDFVEKIYQIYLHLWFRIELRVKWQGILHTYMLIE